MWKSQMHNQEQEILTWSLMHWKWLGLDLQWSSFLTIQLSRHCLQFWVSEHAALPATAPPSLAHDANDVWC